MSKFEISSEVFNQLIQQCFGSNIEIEWSEDSACLEKIWLSGFEKESGKPIKEVFFDREWQNSPMIQFINPLLDHVGITADELDGIYHEADTQRKGFVYGGTVKVMTH